MKITVKFLRAYTPYAIGDVTCLEQEEAEKLSKVGIVEMGTIRHPEGRQPIEPITGKNINNENLDKGKVDVVIPTTDAKKVENLKKKSKQAGKSKPSKSSKESSAKKTGDSPKPVTKEPESTKAGENLSSS